ncbi:MAG: hypothetical protein CL537_10385 [Alcanivoracaceae bacterium]|uniref:DUF6316 family protein n=1 Tax=Alcanivorax sp. MD8A TaxID=1177157 RepID=UPI000C3618CF|nr:DUF6316 family protein [Alcanivorax sp. MD8A]MAX55897.1 hypothetical protein [Alcanivoracaceae bacterium]MCG8437137.1 DUF6316 family protein [Pseudomonadales bacterium]PNE03272.1 hypothetical protein A15D_01208 [Alcanivorax sp. MD8A]|tara:strand:+ start:1374 stop:1589 length:216 start_codon:yes stop_codon:yes gene_type:complete
MDYRKDDAASRTWFRSDRFFSQGPNWYFSTRENTVEGPYDSRLEAEAGLMLYLRDMQSLESFGLRPARLPG